jgi:hypothetical protein
MIPYDSQDEADRLLDDLRGNLRIEIDRREVASLNFHRLQTQIWRETKLRLFEIRGTYGLRNGTHCGRRWKLCLIEGTLNDALAWYSNCLPEASVWDFKGISSFPHADSSYSSRSQRPAQCMPEHGRLQCLLNLLLDASHVSYLSIPC